MKERITMAVEALKAVRSELTDLLSDAPMLAIRANNALEGLVNFFSHTAGIPVENKVANIDFPAITSFMGDQVRRAKEITSEELITPPDEKAIFRDKVNQLYSEFPDLLNEDILKGGLVDVMVLRGVAKLSGVLDYADADLDYPFLDRIRAAMAGKAEIESISNAAKAFMESQKGTTGILSGEVTEPAATTTTETEPKARAKNDRNR